MDFINGLCLASGSHQAGDGEYCIMEAVAKIAHEPHSDHPATASPVLGVFLRNLNDSMNAQERQQLKPYIMRLLNTNDGKDMKRVNILTYYAVAIISPHALRLTKNPELIKHADILSKYGRSDVASYAASAASYAASDAASYAARVASAASYATRAASAASYAAREASYAASYATNAAGAAGAASAASAASRQEYWDMCLKALDECLAL